MSFFWDGGFFIVIPLLYIFIVLSLCCCKYFYLKSNEQTANLVPHAVPSRYITTVDVQTGLPVLIDIENLHDISRNHATLLATQQSLASCPLNAGRYSYGAMDQAPKTPPPPYSDS